MPSFRKSAGLVLTAVLGAPLGLAAPAFMPVPAMAEECPGHPDALGTSRVLVVEPGKFSRVGVMQYAQSLPLADKEVVLTFDDGPLPPHSTAVLDILAAQCVKATFFLVGEMAREFPAIVRRIHEEGHTIGTHTEHHPARMQKLPIEKVRDEIDRGIADVGGALWDQKDLAPFFRIPGLARSDAIEQELAARSLVVFSSDTVADDWHRRIRSADIVRLALSRLEARGKGILLLHDIHHVTVAALPELLKKLKEDGFHVVHVVPGTGEQAEIASTAPSREANDTNHPSSVTPPNADQANVASAPQSSEQSDPGRPVSVPPPGAQQFAVASDPPLPERNDSDRPTPNTAPSADQAASVTDPAPSERNDADRQMPGTAPSADPTQAASEPSRDPDDPNWPKAEVRLASEERVELPAPDEEAFGTHYHPWRTVILADGSETAAHFALDAVPQWTDPPPAVAVTCDEPQLPVPAMPDYFGGDETVTSIAE